MSAGKGDSPRPFNGDKFRDGYERAFGTRTDHPHEVGEIVDGAECMGAGCWRILDLIEQPVREGE